MLNTNVKQALQTQGVVGAGGAGFPTYAKLADGAEILLINAVECEPLMYTDFTLTREKLSEIVEGMRLIMEYAKIPTGLFAIKDYRALKLGLEDGAALADGITVKHIPNVYPMGDEINLIYQATGRLVPPGNLPITKGVIVMNAETVYNAREAILFGTPVTEKWLTVGGDVKEAFTLRAPVGMRIRDVLNFVGVDVPETHVVIDGGPSMGAIKNPDVDVVTKTTKALLILPKTIPAVLNKLRTPEDNLRRAASVCCQCTRCTDMCPRHLLGYPIEPHKMVRSTLSAAQMTPELVKTASLCCGCDICETFACCQDISPMAIMKEYKAILAKNKMRYVAGADEVFTPNPDRDYRMLSAQKWKEVMGVAKFDKHTTLIPDLLPARRVEIRTSQHIGAPSIPVVKAGDTVTAGQLVAEAANGLSLPQYASIAGKVTYVDATKIIIEV
ncbi:MAG: 4Fe-4S dicluster domain-containing protein [Clostridia bacterium]|nr:4Fe-4S dicluster domain-containing protein [Clostridia bacterium]